MYNFNRICSYSDIIVINKPIFRKTYIAYNQARY